ncbi:hypothetical protein L6R50_15785 [Myxococcota bacterium]|nr:hypothetical protein [Myxococcota bacterium]
MAAAAACVLAPLLAAAGAAVAPPAPPLEQATESLTRAERDLAAADAADRLFVRLARRFQSLPAARGRSACGDPVRSALVARALAAWWAMGERVAAAGARVGELRRAAGSDTAALLFPSDLRRIEAAEAELARLRRLAGADRAILETAVEEPLRRAGCDPEGTADVGRTLPGGGPWIATPAPFGPDPWVAVGFQAEGEPVLVWVDGRPTLALAAGELAVVAVTSGSHTLCASRLEAERCAGGRAGGQAMGAWHVATPGSIRPAGDEGGGTPVLAEAPADRSRAIAPSATPGEAPSLEPPPDPPAPPPVDDAKDRRDLSDATGAGPG